MFLTLLFYLSFAIGAVALLALAINVVHGMGWKVRGADFLTILSAGLVCLTLLALTRQFWFVPVGDWPVGLQAFAAACCAVSWLGLPIATFLRRSRPDFADIKRSDKICDLVGDRPRDRFIGKGRHHWMLQIPGNEALDLLVHEW